MKTLLEAAPREFKSQSSFTQAWGMRDINVIRENCASEHSFPGSHKHVMVWWELENGHAVGFNENPSVGYSFPVVKYDRIEAEAKAKKELGLDDFLFRNLSPKEELDFKKWARDNFVPGMKAKAAWHPIVREEWEKLQHDSDRI